MHSSGIRIECIHGGRGELKIDLPSSVIPAPKIFQLAVTCDPGPESVEMYDSDMKVYLGKGSLQIQQNIAQMERWAAEGK